MKAGMSEYDALRAITINPAKHLGIEDRVGSIECGKDADLILCTGNPFSIENTICHVFIEGTEVN